MRKITICLLLVIYITPIAKAQEGFTIEFGQFFEQGYGGEGEERSLDLQEVNNGIVHVGWEKSISRGSNYNAAIWSTNEIGELKWSLTFAEEEKDLVATSVLYADNLIYVTLHESSNYTKDEVFLGDAAIIKVIDTLGSVVWSYRYANSGYGHAPADIIEGPSESKVILLNTNQSGAGIGVEYISVSIGVGLTGVSSPYYSGGNGSMATEILEWNNSYVTIINNLDNHYPSQLVWSKSGLILNLFQYTSLIDHYYFGVLVSPVSNRLVSSGYRINSEDEKDASLVELDQFGSINGIQYYGISGNEEFYDICLGPDHLIACGIRDNLGEGGDDIYVAHVPHNLGAPLLEETLGGKTDDVVGKIVVKANGYTAYLCGQDVEYGIANSGNAYLCGIKTGLNNFSGAGNCYIPRIIFFGKPFEYDASAGSITSNIGTNAIRTAFRDYVVQNNIQVVIFSGIDLLLEDIGKQNPTYSTTDHQTAMNDIDALLQLLIGANVRSGMVAGYDEDKIDDLNDFIDMTFQYNQMNYNRAGKLHFMMLEHELWNPSNMTDLNSKSVSDPPYLGDIDLFYLQLRQDHYSLLDHMNQVKPTNANAWKTLAYINHAWNTQAGSGANAIDRNSSAAQLSFIQGIESRSDYILAVYYLNNQWNNGLDFLIPGEDWDLRINDFGSQTASSNIIPLFSAEYWNSSNDFCGDNSSTDFLGKYLDGPPANPGTYVGNDLNSVENHYLNMHTNFNITHKNNIFISAFAWFRYECLKDKNFLDKTNIACGSYGGNGVLNATSFEESKIEVYPNPTSDWLSISGDLEVKSVLIRDLQGKLVSQAFVNDDSIAKLPFLKNGFYTIEILFIDGSRAIEKLMIEN